MRSDLNASASVEIEAPVAEVWQALTTPSVIKQWFFGVDTRSDWTEGSDIVHTHWSDLSGLPDRPEHYQEVMWALAERGGTTELTVSETNLPSEQAKTVSETSWTTVLGNLKELLEG